MCGHCGCGQDNHVHLINPAEPTKHQHIPPSAKTIHLEQDILLENNRLAEINRAFFKKNKILCLNLLSSPGAGKTTLLEQTISHNGLAAPIYVIEGDQQTTNDADRIEKAGAKAVQINTGTGCHLDANMVHRAVHELQMEKDTILFIENVGNLVCPSLFDLGESLRVVIFSVTEGEDKPLKYSHVFEKADVCIIHKTDLMPYVNFEVEKAKSYVKRINRNIRFFEISSTSKTGLDDWFSYLKQAM